MKIILDAGHGQGSAHNRGSVVGNEGDNNYAFSLVLKKELEKYGIQVGLTRPNPAQDPSLNARGAMAAGYDMFISLHSNAATASVRGTEIYNSVQRPAPSGLVNALVADISKFFGHANRGVKTRKWNNGDYYGVLRSNLAKVGFLIEYGFHTNRQDAEIYVSKRQELAEITASRIASHYGLKKTSAPDKPASKPTQSSPTYYDYPPATYEVLRAINTYDKPSGNVKGKLAKGAKIKAIKEVRSGVPGVWLQLDNKLYIQAQEWRTVNVKKIAAAKPVQGIDGRTSGTWQVTARIGVNVRTKPSTDADADIVAAYQKGQKVNIHSTVTAEGYIWGQYIGATSGQKRYVALGTTGGARYGKWV
mgnify:FL=1